MPKIEREARIKQFFYVGHLHNCLWPRYNGCIIIALSIGEDEDFFSSLNGSGVSAAGPGGHSPGSE